MAGERVKLEVRPREGRGSREARRLRREGLIPGVLYGRDEPRAISIPERDLRRALTGAGGTHAVLDVVLDGETDAHASILKDFQRDPVRGYVTHVDLHEIRLDRPIQASVSVTLLGEPVGVTEGGVLSQAASQTTVEALPLEVPEHIDIDVTGLNIGDSVRVDDLPKIEGVTYLDDPDMAIASVGLPTRVEEPEPEEVLEEGEEGEGVPEGEEAPEGAAEAPAESEADAATGDSE
jgi:large subunit ribosomal protein L25